MNKSPGLDLAERARALQPLIARDADEIERTRRLTPAVTQALIENGLYRSLLPSAWEAGRRHPQLRTRQENCGGWATTILRARSLP